VPSLSWATPEIVPEMHRRIDDAAAEAGRQPRDIRRVYNVSGTIADGPVRGLLDGPPDHWAETLTSFAKDLGFDTFILWPSEDPKTQVQRFAEEIVPAVRSAVDG
jgi:hypothetical protein